MVSSTNKTQRITLSLPSSVVSDLDFLSKALGVSRSAFVSAAFADLLPPLVPLASITSKSSESDSKRYRGEFIAELNKAIERLNAGVEGLQDDLFKE